MFPSHRGGRKVDASAKQLDGLSEIHHRNLPPEQSMSHLQATLHEKPHITRLMRPKAPLTWLLCLCDNVQYSLLAANGLSVMTGFSGYPLGSAWPFLLSTPHHLSTGLYQHLPVSHFPPIFNSLRLPVLPVPTLFHAETCL